MNYAEITTAVQNYLATSEAAFVATIPTFVKMVENRVYNDPHMQLPALRKNVQGSIFASDKYVSMPNDFVAVFSFALVGPAPDGHRYLEYKDVNLIREVYPQQSLQDTPKYYGLFDATTLILGPTPPVDYDVELHYFFYPDSIVNTGTSWLGDNFPSVLLYGAIAEGYRFQKGDAAQQKVYDDQYAQALQSLQMMAEGRVNTDAFSNNKPRNKIPTGE